MIKPSEGTFKLKLTEIVIGDRARQDLGDLLGLAESIKQNGLINPIVVEWSTKKLIAGYRRIEALKLLKIEEVEARKFEELSPYEIRRLELEENIVHKKGLSWQEEVTLKKELHGLYLDEHKHERQQQRKDKPWSQKSTAAAIGISVQTLSEELRLAQALQLFPQLKDVASKKEAIRKMYRLREYALLQELARRTGSKVAEQEGITFINDDCFNVFPTIKDESVDLIITDPPWGINLKDLAGAGAVDYKIFKDNKVTGDVLYKKAIPELFRVLKDGGHLYLFFDIASYEDTTRWLRDAGFDVRPVPCIWVKDKPGFTDFTYKHMPMYESFLFAVKNVKNSARPLNEPLSDVFVYARQAEKKIHPTEKPIDLLKRLISVSSNKGDTVLDPFVGSGSLLIAAYLLQRKAIGIELEKEYFEIAKGRIDNVMVEIEVDEDATELEGAKVEGKSKKPN